MKTRTGIVVLWALAIVGSSCKAGTPSPPPTSTAKSTTSTSVPSTLRPPSATPSDLAFCVQDVNRYRARVRQAPVRQSANLESFAADGARVDAAANEPHYHYRTARGGAMNLYENEMLRADLAGLRSVQGSIQTMNELIWAEGPSGGHYRNALGARTVLGCGVYIANDQITIVQDFQ